MKAVYLLLCVEMMDHRVVMVAVVRIGLECRVDKIERIDRLEEFVFLAPVDLPHIRLCGIEEDALPEGRCPVQLHLNDERAAAGLFAAHVNDAVFLVWVVRHHLRRQILDRLHLLAVVKGKQGIEKADDEVLVLAKDLLEGDISLGVKILCHVKSRPFFHAAGRGCCHSDTDDKKAHAQRLRMLPLRRRI